MARAEISVTLLDLPLVKNMALAIAEVRLIHRRNERYPYFCVNCRAPHPCRTIRALDAIDSNWPEVGNGPA